MGNCMNSSNDRLFKGPYALYLLDLLRLSPNESFRAAAFHFLKSNYEFMVNALVNTRQLAVCTQHDPVQWQQVGLVWMSKKEVISPDMFTSITSALQLVLSYEEALAMGASKFKGC